MPKLMGKQDLAKMIQNSLAYPFAWEKVGLGGLPVEKVAVYCQDRAAHLAEAIWSELVTFEAERAEAEEAEQATPE